MKFSVISTLALAAVASAMPAPETTKAECVKPYLCCGSLTTPLDSTVDPILAGLGVNAANVVGEVGLDCMSLLPSVYSLLSTNALLTIPGHAYDKSCPTGPKCCTEANLLVYSLFWTLNTGCDTDCMTRVVPLLLAAPTLPKLGLNILYS